ncbi:hypothetical protein LTR53_005728 [Teratosphaeriaceae sp. CCFEE 6253]|nr:hypothetical protein LTR53_005728 [Teratosphaeriaceae sp. CCFEE 6253]
MKSITTFCVTLLAGAITASAQNAASFYNYTQSPPFGLVLLSHDAKYNGSALSACHEGAAIESLCALGNTTPTSSASNTFYFNTTTDSYFPNYTTDSQPGLLVFNLPVTGSDGPFNASSPMSLRFDASSNLAGALFHPGYEQVNVNVAVTPQGHLNIPQYFNGTAVPLERWYVCETDYGYEYESIVWLMGDGTPDDPTCCPVEILVVEL